MKLPNQNITSFCLMFRLQFATSTMYSCSHASHTHTHTHIHASSCRINLNAFFSWFLFTFWPFPYSRKLVECVWWTKVNGVDATVVAAASKVTSSPIDKFDTIKRGTTTTTTKERKKNYQNYMWLNSNDYCHSYADLYNCNFSYGKEKKNGIGASQWKYCWTV